MAKLATLFLWLSIIEPIQIVVFKFYDVMNNKAGSVRLNLYRLLYLNTVSGVVAKSDALIEPIQIVVFKYKAEATHKSIFVD